MLKVGEIAPLDTKVLDQNQNPVSLSELLGKPTVVYFYPKDNTPGCTKEACSFRDFNKDLKNLGIQIIGISGDSPESHIKFSDRHELNFPLWSDQDRKLITAFGAIGEKSMFGKIYQGILRITFVLDKNGKIIKVWPKVKAENHAQEVSEFFKNLTLKNST